MSDIVKIDKLRTIRLYGKLGAIFGRVHRFVVGSPTQAIGALCAMIPGFEKHLMESHDNGIAYAVFVGKKNVDKDMLDAPAGSDDIRIAPIIMGSKQAGLFQVVVGIVLVVASFFTGGATLALIGAAVALGGAIAMLSPQPKAQSSEDRDGSKASYVFNGAVNTQAQGNPVPLMYGEGLTGSAVISAAIRTEDQV